MDVQIAANGRLYTAVADLTTTFRLVVAGRLTDALDGGVLRRPLRVEASRRGLVVKTFGDGLFAVAADPALAFPLLATDPYDFELAFTVPGYRPLTVAVPVSAGSVFPLAELAPALRRLPVRVQGRVTAAATGAPLAGARVGLQEAQLLPLAAPLAFPHPPGTEVRECTLAPVGPLRQVAAPAAGGGATLVLSDRLGLAPGQVLRLGPPHRAELGLLASLAPEPADPGLPGEVTLSAPLRRSQPQGSPVQRVSALPGAASQPLGLDAAAGEGVLVLAGPLAVSAGGAVRVEVPPSPALELHLTGTETDAAGYYRLDGVAGIAGATFLAGAAGFLDGVTPWIIDATHPVNVLDFRLETP